MIVGKTNPVSEDKWIERLLNSMERVLLPSWGINTSQAVFYGRVESIDGQYRWFNGNANISTSTNDKVYFTSYIKVDEEAEFNVGKHSVGAKLVCQGNLKSLYPSITHRPDAELRKSCIEVLLLHCDMPQYLGYTIVTQDKVKDMQPFHTFELNFNIVY